MNRPTLVRRLLGLGVVVGSLASVGCYHATINTGRPASGEVIKQPWAMSFVAGLVPPPVVETASKCPNGVAKVETQHSFLNMLVTWVTFNIVSPMTIEVTCAAAGGGGGMAQGANVIDAHGAAPAELEKAFNQAIETAQDQDAPVFVRL